MLSKKKILKCENGFCFEKEDYIVREKKVRILINGKHYKSLYASPDELAYLACGFLYTKELLRPKTKFSVRIEGLDIFVDIKKNSSESSSSGEIIRSDMVVHREKLIKLFNEFNKKSEVFKLTGGVHAAALTDGREILYFSEDIGRHNAVDKVIGKAFMEKRDFCSLALLISGRISSEIIEKCLKAGIPVIASKAAPTSLAIEMAEKSGITLIGFLRGNRFNIYCHPERLKLGSQM